MARDDKIPAIKKPKKKSPQNKTCSLQLIWKKDFLRVTYNIRAFEMNPDSLSVSME